MLDQLTCPNCGAALPAQLAKSDVVTCQYCHVTFRVPHSFTPEPDMGDLILGADFSHQPIAGWGFPNPDDVQTVNGNPPEFRAKFKNRATVHYVLNSSGYFDNLDAGVNVCFYGGNQDDVTSGLILRYRKNVGSYNFFISPLGTYAVACYEKSDSDLMDWKSIISWTKDNIIRAGFNQVNRLRVIANGTQFKFYINGVLTTSIHDSRYEDGEVILGVEGSAKSTVEVGFGDLQLREVLSNGK